MARVTRKRKGNRKPPGWGANSWYAPSGTERVAINLDPSERGTRAAEAREFAKSLLAEARKKLGKDALGDLVRKQGLTVVWTKPAFAEALAALSALASSEAEVAELRGDESGGTLRPSRLHETAARELTDLFSVLLPSFGRARIASTRDAVVALRMALAEANGISRPEAIAGIAQDLDSSRDAVAMAESRGRARLGAPPRRRSGRRTRRRRHAL